MRTRSDRGQATVLTLVFLVVLLGMAALVLDIGSWYRADRAVQSTADAAALAGAQSLPYNPGNASTLAVQYGDKNGGGVNGSGITISNSSLGVNDTITVHLTRPAPGVFTKLFGVNSVTVGAHATARASLTSVTRWTRPSLRLSTCHARQTSVGPAPPRGRATEGTWRAPASWRRR